MRLIETHKGDPTNDPIKIVADEVREWYDVTFQHSQRRSLISDWLTNETLLAIVADRLDLARLEPSPSKEVIMAHAYTLAALTLLKNLRTQFAVESVKEPA